MLGALLRLERGDQALSTGVHSLEGRYTWAGLGI